MKNFFKHSTYLTAYIVLIFLINISLTSTVAFFHFQLGHRLPDVEDWMFEHQWEILSISKVTALFVVFRFLSIRGNFRRPFNDIVNLSDIINYKVIFVGLFFLLMVSLYIGRPIQNDTDFYFLRLSSSAIGNIVFLLSDTFLWFALSIFYPLEKGWKRFAMVLFPILCLYLVQTFILYGRNVDTITFIHFLVSSFLIHFGSINNRPSWGAAFLYSIVVQCSLSTFFGLDPIWRELYSPFRLGDGIKSIEYMVLVVIMFGYFFYKKYMRMKRMRSVS